eukprot:1557782-Rhodomonas_salina.2
MLMIVTAGVSLAKENQDHKDARDVTRDASVHWYPHLKAWTGLPGTLRLDLGPPNPQTFKIDYDAAPHSTRLCWPPHGSVGISCALQGSVGQ